MAALIASSAASDDEPIKYKLDEDDERLVCTKSIEERMTKWIKNEHDEAEYTKTRDILSKYSYPYCWIIPAKPFKDLTKGQKEAFSIEYKVVVSDKNELYYALFAISYADIRALHQKIRIT